MCTRARLGGYLLACLLLVAALVSSPAAWATTGQTGLRQTIPTPTPKGSRPTQAPTSRPPVPTPPPPATDTPVPTAETVIVSPARDLTVTVEPTATSEPRPALTLITEVDSRIAWVGAMLAYTLTLTNQGAAVARDVALSFRLPEGLDPVSVAPAPDASWEGNTLHLMVASLAPGERMAIAIAAVVGESLAPGTVLVSEADAMVAGELLATTGVAVALPPAELPPTGGCALPRRLP